MREVMGVIAAIVLTVWIGLLLPMMFFVGMANQEIIKHVQGYDIVWYKAAWIDTDNLLVSGSLNLTEL